MTQGDAISEERFRSALEAKRGADLVNALAGELWQLPQQAAALSATLHELRLFQDYAAHLIEAEPAAHPALALPDHVTVHAHEVFDPQDGFYQLENDADGRPFRWTGPQRHVSIVVCIDRSVALNIVMEVIALIDDARQRNMSLLVDGTTIPFPLDPVPGGYVGRANLPPARHAERTRLTFLVPHVALETAGCANPRLLGFAFRSLAISPAARLEQKPHGVAPSFPTLLPTRFACSATDIAGDNPYFFPCERDADARPFCWSGRQTSFAFEIAIDRSAPAEMRLRLITVISLQAQSPLRLDVDETAQSLDIVRVGALLEAHAILPARQDRGTTVLRFTVPALLVPQGETRQLGVAFHELHFGPAPVPLTSQAAAVPQVSVPYPAEAVL